MVFIQLASGSQGRSEGGGGAAFTPQKGGETRRRAREGVVSTRNLGKPIRMGNTRPEHRKAGPAKGTTNRGKCPIQETVRSGGGGRDR